MTTYYCKCGRKVKKSTSADNTGNRDVDGCEGCPYLMDYGPYRYIEGKGFQRDVQGQECRMSPVIDYHTTYMGNANDKCTLRIVSLDLDFLGEVQAWIDENIHDGDLSGGFSPGSIRPTDYSHNGRFSWSISCAQNRKGMKAKSELIERFFDGQRHRKDIDPATEERMILDKIAAGKAAAHKKEDSTLEAKQYKTEFDTVYAVRQLPSGEYRIMCRFGQGEWTKATDPKFSAPCNCAESLQEVLDAYATRKGWPVYGPKDPCKECRCKTCADESCLQAHCDGSDHGMGCIREDGCYAPSEAEPENTTEETPAPAPLVPESSAGAPALPRFDYSGMDEATVNDLHLAAREVASGKKMAEIGLRRMADGVAIAHDALCLTDATFCRNGETGKFSKPDQAFGAWCESVGLNRKAAERLLNVARLFDASSPKEQQVLETLGPTLLYAAAKPSAPAEAVQAVKAGDITTHKQYRELVARLDAEKSAREQAERDLSEARNADKATKALLYDEQQRRQEANEARIASEKERDGARDALRAAKMRGDKLFAENRDLRAKLQEAPATVEATVADHDEVERLAAKKAQQLAAQQTESMKEQNARDAYDAFLLATRQMDAIWQALAPRIPQLDASQRAAAVERFVQKLMEIKEGVYQCR